MTDRERLALDEEATSLPLHVRMCAFRHDQLITKVEALDEASRKMLEAQNTRLSRIEKAAWGILLTLAGGGGLTLTQLLPAVRAMAGQ
jgi:hypothetical protein